jgi:hypothetical protein
MICDLRFNACEATHKVRRILQLGSLALVLNCFIRPSSSQAFEGHINATIAQGNQRQTLLYTVGTNYLRVELTATNAPNPVDVLDRNSGKLTLIFPHNRSFMLLKFAGEPAASPFSDMPGIPGMPLPPGVGPQPQIQSGTAPQPMTPAMPAPPSGVPPGVGATSFPAMPASSAMSGVQTPLPAQPQLPTMPNVPGAAGMPAMPAMPMMPMMAENLELQAAGQKTNLLGFACERYELKQRGETMEIWATDQLFPFQPYVSNQPNRFGPRMIEDQWAALLKAKKIFPLLVILHFEHGPERYRFEVQAVTPQQLTAEDLKLFQPPDGYFEIQPLPF